MRALIGSVVIAGVGYLGFAIWGGWQEVVDASGRVGWFGLAVTLSLSLVNYGLRFVRWQLYFARMGHAVDWSASLRIYLAGFALTTTPGKAGEAIRGVFLKARAVPYTTSLAAFFSERLSDLTAIVVLAMLAMNAYTEGHPAVLGGLALVLFGLALMSNGRLLAWFENHLTGSSRLVRFLGHSFELARQARRCHTPRVLLTATILSLIAWSAEAWALHLILQWMNLDFPVALAFFVYSVAMLAGALSFLPGGLGGVEAVMISLLIWQGVSAPDAVAASILIRLVTLWFAVLLGVAAFAISVGKGADVDGPNA